MGIAFIQANTQAKTRNDLSAEVYERAQKFLVDEQLIKISDEDVAKPWRASDIKTECPRAVYYSRHEPEKSNGRQSAAALYGTATHTMFERDPLADEDVWIDVWDEILEAERLSKTSDKIDWKSAAKPFSLSAFHSEQSPDKKISALYLRYKEMDLVNYTLFWENYPLEVYINENGLSTIEAVLKTTLGTHAIRTTADVIAYDTEKRDILPVDWKTGRASEASQLATYAMAAERFYDLPDGTITRGMFVLTGAGVCVAKRGQLPHAYEPDPSESVVEVTNIIDWRPVVLERLDKLERRDRTGLWNPKLNALCYRVCEYKEECPVGRALSEVRNGDESI